MEGDEEAAARAPPIRHTGSVIAPIPLNLRVSDLYAEYKTWKDSYSFFELASGTINAADAVRRATFFRGFSRISWVPKIHVWRL